MNRCIAKWGLLTMALTAPACSFSVTTSPPKKVTSPDTNATTSTAPITLIAASTADLEKAIANEKGKVVLLDAWFLACAPCVKKFPHIVALAEKYGPDGLTVMSVDVLESELQSQDEVLAFLKQKRAAFPNFILTDPDVFTEKFGIRATPAVVLIDRAGQVIELSRSPTDDELEAAIRKALAAEVQ